jgi:hypothetical protein
MTILNEIIENQLNNIQSAETMKECLELRLALLKQDFSKKSEYERNEAIILEIRTKTQITKLDELLHNRKQEFDDTMETYIEELEYESAEAKKK